MGRFILTIVGLFLCYLYNSLLKITQNARVRAHTHTHTHTQFLPIKFPSLFAILNEKV